jgi:predicted 3-demethylubiquinone-9 3-methyltransferase (glyoxalase superfamily)
MADKRITICLWFDNQAEEAAKFYTSVFKESKIENISRYGSEGKDIHGQETGKVMTVSLTINNQPFLLLNGGPLFSFTEAVSFQIFCDNQEEIDYYWNKLTEGGSESQCGWLKDRYGVSWQDIPSILSVLTSDPLKSEKTVKAFMKMKKFEIEKLLN